MRSFITILVVFFSINAVANVPSLNNLTDQDVETVAEEFSSLFVHTSVSPARSLGKLFGVEVGVIGGVSEVPGIETLSQQVDPTTDFSMAPFAWLYGAVTVPFGLTIEANILPSMEVADLEFSHYSVGVKWGITDSVLPGILPFDLAVRASYSASELEYQQTILANVFDVNYDNSIFGLDVLASIDLLMIEPYVGIGIVNSDAELGASSPTAPGLSIFADSSASKTASVDSMRIMAGVQFNLALLKLGLEYNHVFDNSRYAAKVSFAF